MTEKMAKFADVELSLKREQKAADEKLHELADKEKD